MVLIVLLVVAIALITIDFRDGGNSGASGVGGRVFGPVERLAGDVTGVFRGTSGNGSEIADLQRQNDQLRAQLAQAQAGDADAAQLAQVLHLSAGKYKVVTGTVIAAGGELRGHGDDQRRQRGRDHGQRDRPQRGRARRHRRRRHHRAPPPSSCVTDAGTTVGVRMAGDGQIGALSGSADSLSGSAPLKLTLFNADATLKPGQELVTFGSVGGRPYVPGVPVGTVSAVTTQPGSLTPTALVKPFADFTGLGVVGVVVSK